MAKRGVVERIAADEESLYFQEHLARYRFCSSFVRPGRVLDIAGGTGYGSAFLAQTPGVLVVSADIDVSSIERAHRVYQDQAIRFVVADGRALPFPDGIFSTIVSLETIEHIDDDVGFLRELERVLCAEGVCLVSTPNRAYSEAIHRANPFHRREYLEKDLVELLGRCFGSVEIYYQGFSLSYHSRVRQYSQDIQQNKRLLNPVVRLAIEYVYRPLRPLVPVDLANFFIARLLRLQYPQPESGEVVIAREPLPETSVVVAVCRNGRSSGASVPK